MGGCGGQLPGALVSLGSWPDGWRAPAQDGSPRQPLLRWVLPKTCWWEVLGEQIHPLTMWGLHTALGQASDHQTGARGALLAPGSTHIGWGG